MGASPPLPPIVLIHGAGNSSPVWVFWQERLRSLGWATHAIDLRGHGERGNVDLSTTSMDDYAEDVRAVVGELPAPPVLMGWSMGGLVAMMVAARGEAGGSATSTIAACIVLAPSMPARASNPAQPLRSGEYGPEVYGITSRDPADQPAMPDLDLDERAIALGSLGSESLLARDERSRGVVVPALSCPMLLVTGGADAQWPEARYRELWLPHQKLNLPGASHWGLVLSRGAVSSAAATVDAWLRMALMAPSARTESGG